MCCINCVIYNDPQVLQGIYFLTNTTQKKTYLLHCTLILSDYTDLAYLDLFQMSLLQMGHSKSREINCVVSWSTIWPNLREADIATNITQKSIVSLSVVCDTHTHTLINFA